MALTSNPPRDPGHLPPLTDDILFVNMSNQDVDKAEYTFTYDSGGGPATHTRTLKNIARGSAKRDRLVPAGVSIMALAVTVEITLAGSTTPDYTLTLGPLSGTGDDWIALVVNGLLRVRPSPTTMEIVPFAEIVKKDGDGIAIT